MKKLISYFIKFPIWANALILITGIAGVLSLFLMPKSFFPEMNPNRVYINVSYPGASPKEIEEAGHDRCPIFLSQKQFINWLTPQRRQKKEVYASLRDKEKTKYSHQFI